MFEEIRDNRSSITTGAHYESLPPRDFQIYEKRSNLKAILLRDYFNNNSMITTFNANHLKILYEYYDKYTFNYELSKMIHMQNRRVSFDTNLKSIRTAGKHRYDSISQCHTIQMSPYLITRLFTKGETNIKTNGIIITDRLSGLLNVFEHEIVHLYCSLKGYTRKIPSGKGKMYYSPHGKLFQELVFRFFGHTDFRHDFTNGEASEQLSKSECQLGMAVYFNQKSKVIYGKIIKINPKRCKVKIEKGLVYNVPYSMLRKDDQK